MVTVDERVTALVEVEDRITALAEVAPDGVTVGDFVDAIIGTLSPVELEAIAEAYLLDFVTSDDDEDEAEPDELERSSVKVRDVLTIGALKSPVMFGMEQ